MESSYVDVNIAEVALIKIVAEAIGLHERCHAVIIRPISIDLAGLRINRENNVSIAFFQLLDPLRLNCS